MKDKNNKSVPCKVICKLSYSFQQIFSPIANLASRLCISNIFIKAGLTKTDNWNATLFLFENEYQVPLLPYSVAAVLSVILELVIAPMLAFGFLTKFCALSLLVMSIIINYTYQSSYEHYYWMVILGMLFTYGGNCISIDILLKRKFCKKNCKIS